MEGALFAKFFEVFDNQTIFREKDKADEYNFSDNSDPLEELTVPPPAPPLPPPELLCQDVVESATSKSNSIDKGDAAGTSLNSNDEDQDEASSDAEDEECYERSMEQRRKILLRKVL